MCLIKLCTKCIFQIFKINRIMPFCYFFGTTLVIYFVFYLYNTKQGKHVRGNDIYSANIVQKRKYR